MLGLWAMLLSHQLQGVITMSKQGAFNTNRQYTARGQRVGFCHLSGSVYVFFDIDRLVTHAVDVGTGHEFYGPTMLKQELMKQYDRSQYLYDLEFGPEFTVARDVAWNMAQDL